MLKALALLFFFSLLKVTLQFISHPIPLVAMKNKKFSRVENWSLVSKVARAMKIVMGYNMQQREAHKAFHKKKNRNMKGAIEGGGQRNQSSTLRERQSRVEYSNQLFNT